MKDNNRALREVNNILSELISDEYLIETDIVKGIQNIGSPDNMLFSGYEGSGNLGKILRKKSPEDRCLWFAEEYASNLRRAHMSENPEKSVYKMIWNTIKRLKEDATKSEIVSNWMAALSEFRTEYGLEGITPVPVFS